ncbi:MAG: zinc-binding alcohol dehydrogenase family protein, partial [Pseudomonas sp.]
MKAIAYYQSLSITDPTSLQDIDLPAPIAGPRDLLVEVKAISVNPVDTKVRQNVQPEGGAAKVLGWDVAGVVKAVGSEVTLFKAGDKVFYAGSIARAGGNSELHVVDERIVGHMPKTLGFAEAAALPLTAITAWELLFDRLQIKEGQSNQEQSLLIVGAAGGVGSILTQLASQLTGLKVIGTASRPQTQEWVRGLGADLVIDHSQPLSEVLNKAGQPQVTHVASLTQTDQHLDQLVEALAPQGKLALIDDPKSLDVTKLKRKSLSLHWEFMYTRSLFETADMLEQHKLLNRVAELIDA